VGVSVGVAVGIIPVGVGSGSGVAVGIILVGVGSGVAVGIMVLVGVVFLQFLNEYLLLQLADGGTYPPFTIFILLQEQLHL
jgi:hypothetical protein